MSSIDFSGYLRTQLPDITRTVASNDGSIMFNLDANNITTTLLGDVYDLSGRPLLTVSGNAYWRGHIKDTSDNTILNNTAGSVIYTGSVNGNLKGKIKDTSGCIFLNNTHGSVLLSGNVVGSLTGRITNLTSSGFVKTDNSGNLSSAQLSLVDMPDGFNEISWPLTDSSGMPFLDNTHGSVLLSGNVVGTLIGQIYGVSGEGVVKSNSDGVLSSSLLTIDDIDPSAIGENYEPGTLVVRDICGGIIGLTLMGYDVQTYLLHTNSIFARTIVNISGDLVLDLPFDGEQTALLTANVLGDVSGSLYGNVTGNILDTSGEEILDNTHGSALLTANVLGDVSGSLYGNVIGNVLGDVSGVVYGVLSGLINGVSSSGVVKSDSNGILSSAPLIISDIDSSCVDISGVPDTLVLRNSSGGFASEYINANTIDCDLITVGQLYVADIFDANGETFLNVPDDAANPVTYRGSVVLAGVTSSGLVETDALGNLMLTDKYYIYVDPSNNSRGCVPINNTTEPFLQLYQGAQYILQEDGTQTLYTIQMPTSSATVKINATILSSQYCIKMSCCVVNGIILDETKSAEVIFNRSSTLTSAIFNMNSSDNVDIITTVSTETSFNTTVKVKLLVVDSL